MVARLFVPQSHKNGELSIVNLSILKLKCRMLQIIKSFLAKMCMTASQQQWEPD